MDAGNAGVRDDEGLGPVVRLDRIIEAILRDVREVHEDARLVELPDEIAPEVG
jgi:hypothetical protein